MSKKTAKPKTTVYRLKPDGESPGAMPTPLVGELCEYKGSIVVVYVGRGGQLEIDIAAARWSATPADAADKLLIGIRPALLKMFPQEQPK